MLRSCWLALLVIFAASSTWAADNSAPVAASLAAPVAAAGSADSDLRTAVSPLPEPADPSLFSPVPEPVLGHASAAVVQYTAGFCSSGLCCGGTGVVGAVLLVLAIAVPFGSVIFGPMLGVLGCAGASIAPAMGVSVGVWLRDWLGPSRGPWVWPVVAAYAFEALTVVAMTGLVVLGTALTGAFFSSLLNGAAVANDPTTWLVPPGQWAWASLGVGGAIALGGFWTGIATAILVPAGAGVATTELLAVPKEPGDVGFHVPGFFEARPFEPEVPDPDAAPEALPY